MATPLASYKGVGFFTQSNTESGGRKNQIWEQPFADKPGRAVDLGASARRFNFTAVFVGPTYQTQLNAFLAVLDQPGPGVLIHPDHGRRLCVLDGNYSIRRTTRERRYCTLDFNLMEVEGDVDQQPLVLKNPYGKVKTSSAAGIEVAKSVFSRDIPSDPISDFVAAARFTALDNVVSDLTKINNKVARVLQVPATYAAQLNQFATQLEVLASTPSLVADSLATLSAAIADTTTRVTNLAGESQLQREVELAEQLGNPVVARTQAINGFAAMGNTTPLALDIDTDERRAQAQERTTILSTSQAIGLLSMAQMLPDFAYDSSDEADSTRSVMVDALLELADQEIDYELSVSLRQTAGDITELFTDLDAPDVVEYTPGWTTPAELISYLLYGTSLRAEEIAARNKLQDPSAIQGGVSIEVLDA